MDEGGDDPFCLLTNAAMQHSTAAHIQIHLFLLPLERRWRGSSLITDATGASVNLCYNLIQQHTRDYVVPLLCRIGGLRMGLKKNREENAWQQSLPGGDGRVRRADGGWDGCRKRKKRGSLWGLGVDSVRMKTGFEEKQHELNRWLCTILFIYFLTYQFGFGPEASTPAHLSILGEKERQMQIVSWRQTHSDRGTSFSGRTEYRSSFQHSREFMHK